MARPRHPPPEPVQVLFRVLSAGKIGIENLRRENAERDAVPAVSEAGSSGGMSTSFAEEVRDNAERGANPTGRKRSAPKIILHEPRRVPSELRIDVTALALAYPPAMAPTISSGSAPVTTAAGSGVSADSCERSCAQAKNLTNGRRRCDS